MEGRQTNFTDLQKREKYKMLSLKFLFYFSSLIPNLNTSTPTPDVALAV
jgi:hypothetical protein